MQDEENTDYNLQLSTSVAISSAFGPLMESVKAMELGAFGIIVRDATEVSEMKEARALRLKIRDVRLASAKVKKSFSDDLKKRKEAFESIADMIDSAAKKAEAHLEKQEKFAEYAEIERQDELRVLRSKEIEPYLHLIPGMSDLGKMKLEVYNNTLEFGKQMLAKEISEREKAENLRLKEIQDKEIAAKIERERQEIDRIERARLLEEKEKAERDLAEAKRLAVVERQALEAKAKKERDEHEKEMRAEKEKLEEAQKEAKRLAVVERQALEAKAKKERDEQNAPDIEKLIALAIFIETIKFPDVSGEVSLQILEKTRSLLSKTSAFIREKVTLIIRE